MSKKPAGLSSFIASKANAGPSLPAAAPEVAPRPAPAPTPPAEPAEPPAAASAQLKRGPKPQAKAEPLVPVNFVVPKSYRAELKKLAANRETTVTEILKQGVELYRAKHAGRG